MRVEWAILLAVILVAVFFAASHALGMPNCTSRGDILDHLFQRFGETRVAMGTTAGSVMEVMASEYGNTWTIIITAPNGHTCLLTAGTHLKFLETRP